MSRLRLRPWQRRALDAYQNNTRPDFLAVATPPTDLGSPDLHPVRSAARAVAQVANGKRPILVSKSSAPVVFRWHSTFSGFEN